MSWVVLSIQSARNCYHQDFQKENEKETSETVPRSKVEELELYPTSTLPLSTKRLDLGSCFRILQHNSPPFRHTSDFQFLTASAYHSLPLISSAFSSQKVMHSIHDQLHDLKGAPLLSDRAADPAKLRDKQKKRNATCRATKEHSLTKEIWC